MFLVLVLAVYLGLRSMAFCRHRTVITIFIISLLISLAGDWLLDVADKLQIVWCGLATREGTTAVHLLIFYFGMLWGVGLCLGVVGLCVGVVSFYHHLMVLLSDLMIVLLSHLLLLLLLHMLVMRLRMKILILSLMFLRGDEFLLINIIMMNVVILTLWCRLKTAFILVVHILV